MSQFTLMGNRNNATSVSNTFIDEFMKDANGSQIKIYLYLLRMFQANLPTDISRIADYFNFMEKDVIRALQYWEKRNVLSLDINDEEHITGVTFLDLTALGSENSTKKATKEISLRQQVKEPVISAIKVTPLTEREFEKPPYSPNQVKAFRECDDAQNIIMFAEAYLKKQLTPSDITSLFFIYDELHFSVDLIDCLIQYCAQRGKRDFRYIETVAIAWAKDGITTPELAAAEVKKRESTVYAIMRALGKNGQPTDVEMSYMNRWLKEYSFHMDIISEACSRTVLSTDKHRFEYAEKILKSWSEAGVHNLADIKTADQAYEKTKSATQKNPASQSVTSTALYNQFAQNQYDYDALERELLQ